MTNNTFLVELGTEELPPTQLKQIAEDFSQGLVSALEKANVPFGEYETFATPRRIAVLVKDLASKSKNQVIEKRGPAKQACFDTEGNLSKAAQGWLRSNGIEFEQASFLETDKGAWLYYKFEQEGRDVRELLFDAVSKACANIQIAKGMRWGDNDFTFIRPVKTFTMLFNEELIEGEMYGVKSDRLVKGHRFLGESEFALASAQDYVKDLVNKGKVMPSFSQRVEAIQDFIADYTAKNNCYVSVEQDLLEEIASLVEYPTVMVASFDKEFLEVPKEALIHTMEGDQRYFPIFKDSSMQELLPNFIFVSNINPADQSKVILGNEKVIRPRLTDAKFFYEQDLKKPLESLLPRLEMVVFQKQLGTVYDKTLRLVELAKFLAPKFHGDAELAGRAALLSKCDLMTNMVFEFTDTQGIMGMYYATKGGENPEVAQALNEQYLPRFSGDSLPATTTGSVLSLADKVDTLVGIFGINQPPKGAKDPFALRRASIAIIRILAEGKYDINLEEIVDFAISNYGDKLTVETNKLKADILAFVSARIKALYEDQGYSPDELQAVLTLNINNPYDFFLRLQAVKAFKDNDAYADLSAANKRVKNFLSKAESIDYSSVKPALFATEEEKALFAKVEELEAECHQLEKAQDYFSVLSKLASTREVVNQFFDNVIVNADDAAVKANRYALLAQFNALCSLVADLSALSV